MKVIFTLIILFASLSVNAQSRRTQIGLSSSIDFNTYFVEEDRWPADFRLRFNYSVGPVIRYALNDRLSLGSGVLLSTKNVNERLDLEAFRPIDPSDPILVDIEPDRVLRNFYLDIPTVINYKFKEGEEVEFYGSLGFVNSLLLSSKENGRTDSRFEILEYNEHLISTKIGAGVFIKKETLGLYIEPQIRIYLNDVHTARLVENPVHFGLEFQLVRI